MFHNAKTVPLFSYILPGLSPLPASLHTIATEVPAPRNSEHPLQSWRSNNKASRIYSAVEQHLRPFSFALLSQELGLGAQEVQEVVLAQFENQVERARGGDAGEHGDDVCVTVEKE